MKRIAFLFVALLMLCAGQAAAQQSIKSGSVVVTQGATDEVMTFFPRGARRFGATVVVATNTLDAFQINFKFHADDTFHTVYDAAGEFTAPTGVLVGTSTDLTVAAAGSHWFILDTGGVYEVQIKASSAGAAGSGVTIRGTLSQ